MQVFEETKPDDAADALAVAITCGFLYREGMDNESKFSNSRGRKSRSGINKSIKGKK